MRVALVLVLAVVAAGCTFSSNDRAGDLASATPTTVPSDAPDPTPADGDADTNPNPGDAPVATETPVSTDPGWLLVQNVDVALNVRDAPGTDSTVLGQADLGTSLLSTGNRQAVGDSDWVEVEFEDGLGWVHGDFVAATVAPTPTPLATPTPLPTPTPSAGDGNLVVDADGGLNLRSEPNADASIIRKIDDGATVTPTGETSTDEDDRVWVEIRDGDDTGWVAQEFVKST